MGEWDLGKRDGDKDHLLSYLNPGKRLKERLTKKGDVFISPVVSRLQVRGAHSF